MDGRENISQPKKRSRSGGKKKVTPATLYKQLISFGKIYQIDGEQDFQEVARIYSEEAGLIQQIRDVLDEEGLTVTRSMKNGGECPAAHPLLSELPRHIDSANKCLATISELVIKRGQRTEHAARALDSFRIF